MEIQIVSCLADKREIELANTILCGACPEWQIKRPNLNCSEIISCYLSALLQYTCPKLLNMGDYISRWGWNKDNEIFPKVTTLSFNSLLSLKLTGLQANFSADSGLFTLLFHGNKCSKKLESDIPFMILRTTHVGIMPRILKFKTKLKNYDWVHQGKRLPVLITNRSTPFIFAQLVV